MIPSADILLVNGRVLTAAGSPTALAVADGKVLATGSESDIRRLVTKRTTILDCAGRAVIPGIVDAHCHVLASAAASLWVGCRPAATRDVSAIVEALRRAEPSPDNWVRGYGYDDSPVGLGRHLNRYDLDRVSTARPVRVEHRSGHACVLNSCGLAVGRDRPSNTGPSRRRAIVRGRRRRADRPVAGNVRLAASARGRIRRPAPGGNGGRPPGFR